MRGAVLQKVSLSSAWHMVALLIWPCVAVAAPPPLDPEHEAVEAHAQALQAMQDRQWAQAELLLERVLMFQPENAEVMVQLAQLLAQRGRTESAQAILRALLADVRTPAPQRERLQVLLASAATMREAELPVTPPARQWLEWTLGRGANPLVATAARDITLTLPAGSVTLPLDARPQSGTYSSVWLARLSNNGTLVQVQAQGVDLAQARTALRLSAQGILPVPEAKAGAWQWQLQTQRLLDGTYRHQAGIVLHRGAFQLHTGVYSEPQARRHGPYARVLRHWVTPAGHQVQAWGDLEPNQGAGAPGLLRLGGQAVFSLGTHWQWQNQLQHHHDLAGYSPLLENNRRRNILTASTALEYQFEPLADRGWVLRAYGARRWSDIPLFAWKDFGAQIVWRAAW